MDHSNNGIEDSQLSIDHAHHLCEIRTINSDNTQAGYVIKNHQQFKSLDTKIDQDAVELFLHPALRRLAWEPAGCACKAHAPAACTVVSKTKVLQRISSFRSISPPTPRRSSVAKRLRSQVNIVLDGVALKSRMIDPRDGVSEIDFPGYRVYFVDSHGATEEWLLTECRSVLEAIDWADTEARQRSYHLYAEWPLSTGIGLVRLLERNGL